MRAYRIKIDGVALGDFGTPNFAGNVMSLNMTAAIPELGVPPMYGISLGGMTRNEGDGVNAYSWTLPGVSLGSKIEIELVESDVCVPPTNVEPPVQFKPKAVDEMREQRRKSYRILREEFGDDDAGS